MSTRHVLQAGVGVVVLLLGIVLLFSNVSEAGWSWSSLLGALWPVILVALGLILIWRTRPWRSGARQIDQVIGKVDVRPEGWELTDLEVQSGIGDIHIDLSRAQIPTGESRIVISGWVGDVSVTVPPSVAVSANGRVSVGTVTILGQKSDGLQRALAVDSPDFAAAERRIRIEVDLIAGNARVDRAG
jgi:predicted membrane protein